MKTKRNKHTKNGFALITLIFFMVIVIVVMSAAVSVLIVNSVTSGKVQQSTIAATVAESGIENGLLRLLRDPGYTGEPPLQIKIGNVVGTATISVNSGKITSIGVYNNFTRKITVDTSYTNNVMTVSNWGENFN